MVGLLPVDNGNSLADSRRIRRRLQARDDGRWNWDIWRWWTIKWHSDFQFNRCGVVSNRVGMDFFLDVGSHFSYFIFQLILEFIKLQFSTFVSGNPKPEFDQKGSVSEVHQINKAL